jgi:alpha-N-arabinofuranosidase
MKAWSLSLLSALVSVSAWAAAPSLTVEAGKPVGTVSPLHYGLMTEEINFCYDGGLYAELVRNRAFLDSADKPEHWSAFGPGQDGVRLRVDHSVPLNAQIPVSLRVDIAKASSAAPAGVANSGYWGIPIMAKTEYKASFFAKVDADGPGFLTVSLCSADGKTTFASTEVSKVGHEWGKHTLMLKTGDLKPTADARLVVSSSKPGTVWLGMVSLFPPTWNNRPNGLRRDLMQMLVDMKPKFLRFPGGNYLEGDTPELRFKWKETLGPIENRPGHQGPWGYRSTDGMGLLEFLTWCEDMGAEPVLGVYAGYSLKGAYIPAGPGLEPYLQEALEEIEYVMGDTSTTWGARRAADGHPAPFKLHYVEIGNEDWFDKSLSYDGRYAQFHDAIRAKYPQLKLISSVGNEQPKELHVKSRVPDLVDEHYYRSADAFIKDSPTQYEKYPRNGQEIFVGEWAAHEDASVKPWDAAAKNMAATPSMKAAIGDAVFMAAMERNADLIRMNCYAPLFVNVNPGARQWRPDMIGYDALTAYGAPSYHVFRMFSTHLGDELLKISANNSEVQASATRDSKSGKVYLKLVNPTQAPVALGLELKDAGKLADSAETLTLAAGPDATNSLTDPVHVVPVAGSFKGIAASFVYPLPANSAVVLVLSPRK